MTADGIAKWQPIVADWLREGRTPTVFLHTPDNTGTPALALAFHTALADLIPDLEPLPTPLPLQTHEQPSLFDGPADPTRSSDRHLIAQSLTNPWDGYGERRLEP